MIVLILIILMPTITSAQTSHLFGGQELDQESRLYYFNQRYYQPEIGRFTQPDPLQNFLVTPELKQKTGLELEEVLANPQRLNSYSYGLNNPVNVVDPTGESPAVSEERQESFVAISDYIRNDESYWLIRDRDGNAAALDAIWQKALALNNNEVGKALDTFYDAVCIDWAHDKVLDASHEEYEARLLNLPNNLVGEYGGSFLHTDKLQHFVASARLAYRYGARTAMLLGRLKEVQDGVKAVFNFKQGGYFVLRKQDEGYSRGDILANRLGIFWLMEYNLGQVNPSTVINNW